MGAMETQYGALEMKKVISALFFAVLLKRCITVLFLLIMGTAFFSGCYPVMQTARIIDGPSITVSAYPIHDDLDFRAYYSEYQSYDVISSVAFRYGWAARREGKWGHSLGISLDLLNPFTDNDANSALWSNYFAQYPKNSILDIGIGLRGWMLIIPSSVYIVLSKELGDRWEIYAEWQGPDLPTGSLGVKFDISEHFSMLAEVSAVRHSRDEIAPILGIGFTLQDFSMRQ